MATSRVFNFSAGPAILPSGVFERAADAVRELKTGAHAPDGQGIGLSLLEISHRSKDFTQINERAIELAHEVLEIPRDTHQIMCMQGGASLQFVMVPMNLALAGGGPACYVDTGAWSAKAIVESEIVAGERGVETRVLASSKETGYDRIPDMPAVPDDAAYVHVTTNNTIYGTEWDDLPTCAAPVIVDASSHIGSRPLHLERAKIGYAGAQKNLGPSGVTLVWFEKSLLENKPPSQVPKILRYGTHADKNGLFNTPNTFGILVLALVLEWVRDNGGLAGMAIRNQAKADALYTCLGGSGLFEAHAQAGHRSRMNVSWTLNGAPEGEREDLTKRFLKEAADVGFSGLKGHRSVGGCRASIYNAFPLDGVEALVGFMREFERTR